MTCTNLVALGTECPQQRTSCIQDAAPPISEDAGAAQPGDAGRPPVMEAPDADLDTGVAPAPEGGGNAPLLAVTNPEFARNGLLDGDLMLYGLIGDILPPSTLVFADVPGWYACGLFSVESRSTLSASDAALGLPTADGTTYISFVINDTPLRQLLPSPLQPGVDYALEMDVLSEGDELASLFVEVQGNDSQCGAGSRLGRSQTIVDHGQWTTLCVSFRAEAEHSHLLLVPGHEGDAAPAATARLLLDNLHPVASCSD